MYLFARKNGDTEIQYIYREGSNLYDESSVADPDPGSGIRDPGLGAF